jgi:hypothetical protein
MRYEVYCTVCNQNVADLKESKELSKEDFKKITLGVNAIYSCPRCFWKPFYNTLMIRVGIRKVKEFSLNTKMNWLGL